MLSTVSAGRHQIVPRPGTTVSSENTNYLIVAFKIRQYGINLTLHGRSSQQAKFPDAACLSFDDRAPPTLDNTSLKTWHSIINTIRDPATRNGRVTKRLAELTPKQALLISRVLYATIRFYIRQYQYKQLERLHRSACCAIAGLLQCAKFPVMCEHAQKRAPDLSKGLILCPAKETLADAHSQNVPRTAALSREVSDRFPLFPDRKSVM